MIEIGGYFNLELNRRDNKLHSGAYKFNTGRNSLEFILKNLPAKKVYIPAFTCDAILEPFHKLAIPFEFYRLDSQLELEGLPGFDLAKDEYLLYTNYFGIKDHYIRTLVSRFRGQLIVDQAQSLFSSPVEGIPSFYSPRKFLGVPDGGYAYLSTAVEGENFGLDYSHARCTHLLKRVELAGHHGYGDFKENSESLSQQPIKEMSLLTRRLIENADLDYVKHKRQENFQYLHQRLAARNSLKVDTTANQVPMVYPLWVNDPSLRQKLIDHRIFVATYWPNVFDWCDTESVEYQLAKHIIALPIDQRYGSEEMEYIMKVINNLSAEQ